MAKRMLIDAAHPEETRVAVISGNRLEEFDYETSAKKQLKGNIYLARVTRVEPSLQAAFVEYGGSRHGFLAFSEIHPDYYRIPVADREALIAADTAVGRAQAQAELAEVEATAAPGEEATTAPIAEAEENGEESQDSDEAGEPSGDPPDELAESEGPDEPAAQLAHSGMPWLHAAEGTEAPATERVETVGGDETEEVADERSRTRPRRTYKIQEVIKRRQIMLVQVSKEERGTKGAALTTYLSLAGRYCVLMPNTPRGGGISRKISSPKERKRMKAILDDLDIAEGMAVILRTAGLERTKAEIKRDLDYLLRLWDSIRETTMTSMAPALIHEEANLIKRAERDLYSKDIDEVLVAGEEGYRTAKQFMRMLMPSHAKKVKLYRDGDIPLFHRYQVESQIDAMHSPTVQLRSGGYVVISPTEALVAIDVNSGRSTRERNIEETAYRTNLEAAEEIARQLRLRDLAGLIVVDFIDMEEDRHNQAVERRLKEAMRSDRARIQLGRISPFGLLELSRQRLRPSFLETHFQNCPTCGGLGMVRTVASAGLHLLRAVEEDGLRNQSAEILVHVPTDVAMYVLNQKRDTLAEIEARYGLRVMLNRDDTLVAPNFNLERIRLREDAAESTRDSEAEAAPATVPDDADESDEKAAPRRRRSRRPRARAAERAEVEEEASTAPAEGTPAAAQDDAEAAEERARKRRRRGKRGGKRRTARTREDGAAELEGTREDDDDDERAPDPETAEPILPAAAAAADGGDLTVDESQPEPETELEPALEPRPMDTVLIGEAEARPEPEQETRPEAMEVAAESEPEAEPEPELDAEPVAMEVVAEKEPEAEPDDVNPDAEPPPFAGPPQVEPQPLRPMDGLAAEPSSVAAFRSESGANGSDEEDGSINQPPDKPRRGWWQRLLDH